MSHLSDPADFLDELSRVSRKLRTLFDARVRAEGLTQPRARLLLHLARRDGRTQSELSELLQIEQPTLVRLIDGLEKNGFVHRRNDAGDRRARRIFLTDGARRQAGDILRFTVELRTQVLAGIDEAELEQATRVLLTVARNIEAAS